MYVGGAAFDVQPVAGLRAELALFRHLVDEAVHMVRKVEVRPH